MTPIVCASGVNLLMDYLEGVASPEVSEALEAHVAGCRKCQAFLASYRATPVIVRDATSVDMPDELAASLTVALRARGLVP
jgi:anti-sigma factor RsiW